MTNNGYLSIVSKAGWTAGQGSACRGYREGIPRCQGNPEHQQWLSISGSSATV